MSTDSLHSAPSARVVADSIGPIGIRLTTLEVVMHRYVLAEFNTHRMFSRSSASSRAIPVDKTLKRFSEDPAFSSVWPAEQPGMQGGAELEGEALEDAQELIQNIHGFVAGKVQGYLSDHPDKSTRLHKSVLNRVLEPFLWHTVVVTATDFDNFWGLRCNALAQPEMRLAAEAMQDAYNTSEPVYKKHDEYHTPYIRPEDVNDLTDGLDLARVSAARCARTSYLTQNGVRDLSEDQKLFERLASQKPPHSAPLEHVAKPCPGIVGYRWFSDLSHWSMMHPDGSPHLGNFREWDQLRHLLGL